MLPTPATDDARTFATKLAALGDPARTREMQGWRAAWEGIDLTNRPSFWDTTVPLRERQPLVRAQLARTAGERLTALVFGDRGFPTIALADNDYAVTLTDSEREILTDLLGELVESMALRTEMPATLDEGLKVSSACVVVKLHDGMLGLEMIAAEWCTPTIDARGECTCLVVQYKTPAAKVGGVQTWDWYRREITCDYDRVYDRVPFDEVRAPDWSKVTYREVPQEFCPVVWYRSMSAATSRATSIDGEPLMRGLEDEIEALDMSLSMRVRTGYYNGDPKMVRMGVDGDAPPAPLGALGRLAHDGFNFRAHDSGPAVKAAPGQIWNLPAGGDAKLLESTGAGATILDGSVTTMRRVITDVMGVLLADPETLGKGDISARALTLMYGPMLNVADRLRSEMTEVMRRVLSHALRLLTTATARKRGVYLATWDRALPVLDRCYRAVASDEGIVRRWFAPRMTLTWGAYFTPSVAEVREAMTAAKDALGGGAVLSSKQALTFLAPYLGITDVDAAHAALTEEAAASHESLNATMSALAGNRDESQTTEPAPTDTASAAPVVENAKDPTTALNGAQVTAMLAIVQAVASGALPRDSGVAMLGVAFPVTETEAERVMGSAGRSFTPAVVTSGNPITDNISAP